MLIGQSYLYTGILLIIFLGAMSRPMTYLALLVSILWTAMVLHVRHGKKSADLCNAIVLVLSLQNFAIGLGAHIAGNTNDSLKLLTQIPFMTVAIIWVIDCFFKKRRLIRHANSLLSYFFSFLYPAFLALAVYNQHLSILEI